MQIHSPKRCLPGGGWFPVGLRIEVIDVPGVGPVRSVEASFVQLSISVTGGLDASREALKDFMRNFLPLLAQHLPE